MIEAITLFLVLASFAGALYFAAKHFRDGIQIYVRANTRQTRKKMRRVIASHNATRSELGEMNRRFDAVDLELKKHGLNPVPAVSSIFKKLEDRHEKEAKLNTVVEVNDEPAPIG